MMAGISAVAMVNRMMVKTRAVALDMSLSRSGANEMASTASAPTSQTVGACRLMLRTCRFGLWSALLAGLDSMRCVPFGEVNP